MVSLMGDDLLMEILIRITTPLLAIRCKLVCKRWCSLISHPYFIKRFKQQHIKHQSRYPKPLLGMHAGGTVVKLADDDGEFNFNGFKLEYLPVNIENFDVVVVASCNDLILCKAEYNLYLCNPFTRQWVDLPPPRKSCGSRCQTMGIGLVCQPYNNNSDDDRFRYRIGYFYTQGYDFIKVETYCSETSEWIQCEDLGYPECYSGSYITAYNGKLHWVNIDGEFLVTYDPFDMRLAPFLRLINAPEIIRIRGDDKDYYHVGECEGVLRVMRLECRYPQLLHTDQDEIVIFKDIRVWELHEGDTARVMIFKERIVFDENVYYDSDIKYIYQIGFHPRNKEVLFLATNEFLSLFNTRTGQVKVESRYVVEEDFEFFTLQLPWWPTPVLNPSPPS